MRIVVDYRPALRARTGVGEYLYQMCRALAAAYPTDSLTLFTSSWKDRPSPSLSSDFPGVRVIDYRLPVSMLNFAWHNLEWPPVELLTGDIYDVAFSPHPLLLPARKAAQVVMIHDLDFLRAPHRTTREIRRDYPRLAQRHARRAAHVIVPSEYTASEVVHTFQIPRERIAVCPAGAPTWKAPVGSSPANGYVLFIGTLEPRKNVGGLLAAYRTLLTRGLSLPRLVIAGQATSEAGPWLEAMRQQPLVGHVDYLGYVADADRQRVYGGARVLVLPSFDEGFGMPVLDAMSLGIPVVASRRGALPELVGDAGLLVDPEDCDSIAAALERILTDETLAESLAERGRDRARRFDWRFTADAVHAAFLSVVQRQDDGP
jgi:glycosyltransferase involved in cell wall biosynthesis